MTSSTAQLLHVATPAVPAMPRGARIAAGLFVGAMRQVSALFARRPASPAEEAAEVRALAYELRNSDPRFAADLFAAADRHELKGWWLAGLVRHATLVGSGSAQVEHGMGARSASDRSGLKNIASTTLCKS